MYPVHHPTLKIEQAERQADAALLRLAATASGARSHWWSWHRPRLTTARGGTPDCAAPAPMPSAPVAAPVPGASVAAGDDRVLVGR